MQPTETFPVVQRTGIRFFRRVTRAFIDFFSKLSGPNGAHAASTDKPQSQGSTGRP